ncbi:MAG: hypothetical protein U0R27_02160 [Candidatus Nanopelagicales bacterium]
MPYVDALPMEAIADTVQRLLLTRGSVALQYGNGQGDQTLREQILEVMAPVGVSAHLDDVVVSRPARRTALDLVTSVFCDPDDVVLVEAPSYVGALGGVPRLPGPTFGTWPWTRTAWCRRLSRRRWPPAAPRVGGSSSSIRSPATTTPPV